MNKAATEAPLWKTDPSLEQIHAAYLAPEAPGHWNNISELVLEGGYGVEPNPQKYGNSYSEIDPSLPDFKISWPSKEIQDRDYQIFFAASKMIIGTLNLEDAIFAQSVKSDIFTVLSESHLFTQLFSKNSLSQGNTVQNHVETVPGLVSTDGLTRKEKFITRMVAVFHDVGKAFNIGRDQLHYHALIASNIVTWFLDTYKEQLFAEIEKHDKRSGDRIFSTRKEGSSRTDDLDTQQLQQIEFTEITTQITEIIRLHHVLEQIDKGRLDLETVAEIFKSKKINSLLYGLFFIADGSSVVPDKALYAKYLIQNINVYIELLKAMADNDYLSEKKATADQEKILQTMQLVLTLVLLENQENKPSIVEETDEEVKTTFTSVDPLITSAWNELVSAL